MGKGMGRSGRERSGEEGKGGVEKGGERQGRGKRGGREHPRFLPGLTPLLYAVTLNICSVSPVT